MQAYQIASAERISEEERRYAFYHAKQATWAFEYSNKRHGDYYDCHKNPEPYSEWDAGCLHICHALNIPPAPDIKCNKISMRTIKIMNDMKDFLAMSIYGGNMLLSLIIPYDQGYFYSFIINTPDF